MKLAGSVLLSGFVLFGASCSNQVTAPRFVEQKFVYGRTAVVDHRGMAHAPPRAPRAVKKMIAAGNELQKKPYKYGGGHRSFYDTGYDCSGTVSYVLHKGGYLNKPLVSQNFFDYGKKGHGDWVDIYMRNGHVFMTIAGLRLDTGGTWNSTGPRWKPHRRGAKGYVVRHPKGL